MARAKPTSPSVEILSSSALEPLDAKPVVLRSYDADPSEEKTQKTRSPLFSDVEDEVVTTPVPAASVLPPVPVLPLGRPAKRRPARVVLPPPPYEPRQSRESFAPVTSATIPRKRPRTTWRDPRLGRAAAVGAIVGAIAFAIFVLGGALAKASSGHHPGSTLLVTAAGPGSSPVPELNVFADGALRCTGTPCRVELGEGTHLVSVSAPGFAAAAPHAIELPERGERAVHFELRECGPSESGRDLPPPEPRAEPPSEAAAAPAPPPFSLVPGRGDEPAPPRAPERSVAPSAPSPAMATLNLNAIPIARVVLDGRPLGSTPRVGIKVTAGTHQVLFLSADGERQARVVDVEAGATRTVAVRF